MAERGARIYCAFADVWCVLSLPSSFTLHRPTPFIEDCAAFAVIVFSARKRGLMDAAGIPTLLGNIVRDGTVYFLVVFAGQLLLVLFELLAPVGNLSTNSKFSAHFVMAAHRDRSHCSRGGKSPHYQSRVSKFKPDYVFLPNSINLV